MIHCQQNSVSLIYSLIVLFTSHKSWIFVLKTLVPLLPSQVATIFFLPRLITSLRSFSLPPPWNLSAWMLTSDLTIHGSHCYCFLLTPITPSHSPMLLAPGALSFLPIGNLYMWMYIVLPTVSLRFLSFSCLMMQCFYLAPYLSNSLLRF